MAEGGWLTFTIVFLVLPLLAVAADIGYLAKEVWTVPWLALAAMMWLGVGLVVGLGFLPSERESG